MRNKILAGILILAVTLLSSFVLAHDYEGWDTIRPLLKDGEGSEFVKDVGIDDDYFWAETELDAVKEAVNWVATNYYYVYDVGEVWTSSDQMYEEVIGAQTKGDCEDWAILLTALLRFHTKYGTGYQEITPDKVWVAINLVTEPGVGVVAAHAWVGYKLDIGGMIHIEPGLSDLYRGSPHGLLNFNDEWVKGGGMYLAGP